MEQADAAARQGSADRAVLRLREAAQTYPAAKQPWSRLADDYFAAGDYGNAILAAQEVLQRDPQDRAAHGILAVAGLRLSVGSLSFMRAQQSGVPTETRAQASELSRSLRDALGEPTLASRPAPSAAPAAPAPTTPRVEPARAEPARASVQPPRAPRPGATAPTTATASTPTPAPPPTNPLDRLR